MYSKIIRFTWQLLLCSCASDWERQLSAKPDERLLPATASEQKAPLFYLQYSRPASGETFAGTLVSLRLRFSETVDFETVSDALQVMHGDTEVEGDLGGFGDDRIWFYPHAHWEPLEPYTVHLPGSIMSMSKKHLKPESYVIYGGSRAAAGASIEELGRMPRTGAACEFPWPCVDGVSLESYLGWCRLHSAEPSFGYFNDDRLADVLCNDAREHTRFILLSNADGSLGPNGSELRHTFCSRNTAKLFVTDLNADNRSDLLCRDTNTGELWGAFADGTGSFDVKGAWLSQPSFCLGADATVFTADFDGDKRRDILCHNDDGQLWIVYADEAGRLDTRRWHADARFCQGESKALYAADTDGDRQSDLLCRDIETGMLSKLVVGHDDAAPVWEADLGWCRGTDTRLRVGDFNGDKRDDLLCLDAESHIGIQYADEHGNFGNLPPWTGDLFCDDTASTLAVVDLNGDGLDDVACAGSWESQTLYADSAGRLNH